MKSNSVYVLQHTRILPNGVDDVKFLGVYSSDVMASTAIERFKTRIGFSQFPDGFHVDRYDIDNDYWVDGFAGGPSEADGSPSK